MKLQLSLDQVDLDGALELIKETKDYIDIIEVGTPLSLNYGVKAISLIKEKNPEKEVLADFKIVDGGEYEASLAYDAGADFVTVLGLSNDATILGAVSAARKFHKNIMVDMICIDDLKKRILSIEKLGVDYLCIHTAVDVQNGTNNPFRDFQIAEKIVVSTKLAIAGGLNIHNIDQIVGYTPDIIIVGAGITSDPNPANAAAQINIKLSEIYKKNERNSEIK